jgi:hypothetical protein
VNAIGGSPDDLPVCTGLYAQLSLSLAWSASLVTHLALSRSQIERADVDHFSVRTPVAILETLRTAQGGQAIAEFASRHGLTPEQADAILATVVPAVSDRIERNTLSRGGIADLVEELGRPEHTIAFNNPGQPVTPAAIEAGIGALDTVFGKKSLSRNIAAQAAVSSGVGQDLIAKLLPILVSIVMGALANKSQGGLGEILKKLPDLAGGDQPQPQPRQRRAPQPRNDDPRDTPQSDGGLGDVLSKIPGFPGRLPQPQGQQTQPFPQSYPQTGGSPLPLPGDRIPGVNAPSNDAPYSNPYGNLPDVIRQGGQSVDGGSLGGVIRSILGSVLGFQNKGVMGWIIRLLVVKWGWGFVQRILSRVILGR